MNAREEYTCGADGTSSSLWAYMQVSHYDQYVKTEYATIKGHGTAKVEGQTGIALKGAHQPSVASHKVL